MNYTLKKILRFSCFIGAFAGAVCLSSLQLDWQELAEKTWYMKLLMPITPAVTLGLIAFWGHQYLDDVFACLFDTWEWSGAFKRLLKIGVIGGAIYWLRLNSFPFYCYMARAFPVGVPSMLILWYIHHQYIYDLHSESCGFFRRFFYYHTKWKSINEDYIQLMAYGVYVLISATVIFIAAGNVWFPGVGWISAVCKIGSFYDCVIPVVATIGLIYFLWQNVLLRFLAFLKGF